MNENEAKLRKEREKADKNRKDRNKDKEKRNDVDERYKKLLESLNKTLQKTAQVTKTLSTETRGEVEIVTRANELIEAQNELLEERLGIIGDSSGKTEEAIDLARQLGIATGTIKLPKDGLESLDAYEDKFADILYTVGRISEYASTDVASRDGVVSDLLGDTTEEESRLIRVKQKLDALGDDILDDTQRKILLDFFQKQIDINQKAIEFNTIYLQQKKDEIALEQGLLAEQLANGEITVEKYQQQLNKLQLQNQELEKLNTQETDYGVLLTDIVTLQNSQIENEMTTQELNKETLNLISQRVFGVSELNDLNDEQRKLVEEINTDLQDQTKIYQETQDVAEKLAESLTKITSNLSTQSQKLSKEQFNQLKNFIKQNETQIDSVKEFFATVSAEQSNLTEEQIENIQRLIDGIEFNQKFAGIQEFANKVIDEFNNISSGIQGVLSSAISLQLEQLDYYEAQIMASIGDETERAKEIQEETRNEIAKTRFDLEKKARLQELGFSLAGALASTAQAVLKALATVPPPGGQILAGIYGGIGAAQALVIKDQINFVKSTQFQPLRRGGLIMGASHEEGGIMANGGLILEGGEAVINKNAVAQFSDLLSQINLSTGGRSLSVDDSALVQEIRKQNQRPIKTYVLYNDIQDTNKINSRLEQISRL